MFTCWYCSRRFLVTVSWSCVLLNQGSGTVDGSRVPYVQGLAPYCRVTVGPIHLVLQLHETDTLVMLFRIL